MIAVYLWRNLVIHLPVRAHIIERDIWNKAGLQAERRRWALISSSRLDMFGAAGQAEIGRDDHVEMAHAVLRGPRRCGHMVRAQ